MHRLHGFAIAGCLVTSLVLGCARQESAADAEAAAGAPAAESAAADVARQPSAPEPDAAAIADATPTATQLTSSAATYTDAQRKFIRTARAEFQVKDVYRSALAIEDAVAAHGGFVVRNDANTQVGSVQRRPRGDGKLLELAEYTVRGTLVVRVPSERTQPFLRSIVTQMEFLDARSFEARDAQFDLLRQQLAWRRNQDAQQDIGTICAGPSGAIVSIDDIAVRLRDQVEEYLPVLRPALQPSGRTLAGLPTVLLSGQPRSVGPVALDVLGHEVRLTATPRW
ncbi:MAG TPA: DUF4349 domain-containing protein, partial [Thermomonas sp.]|nr:DUF4349 domain-containing protein [Thermomonas sp.]